MERLFFYPVVFSASYTAFLLAVVVVGVSFIRDDSDSSTELEGFRMLTAWPKGTGRAAHSRSDAEKRLLWSYATVPILQLGTQVRDMRRESMTADRTHLSCLWAVLACTDRSGTQTTLIEVLIVVSGFM